MEELNTYVFNSYFGFVLVRGKSPNDAYVEYLTSETQLSEFCLTRDDLILRGFKTIKKTSVDKLFLVK